MYRGERLLAPQSEKYREIAVAAIKRLRLGRKSKEALHFSRLHLFLCDTLLAHSKKFTEEEKNAIEYMAGFMQMIETLDRGDGPSQ